MSVTANDVAKYVINAFHEREDLITNLKLQKLLYYVQGWYLGLYGKEIFSEDFEAWVHGPVVPAVYHQYKSYRWYPITEEIKDISNISFDIRNHIDEVLNLYGTDTGWELERRTHLERPWLDARGDIPNDEECTNIIEKNSMRVFFEKLANA